MGLYTYKEIRIVHLELTTRCNAGCPMCARNSDKGGVNPNLQKRDLDLKAIQKIFPIEFIQQLKRVYLCGNYGDPAMSPEALEVLQYFRDVSPGLNLALHTNGGMRDAAWWQKVAKIVTTCKFAIDGLQDTNHLYRRGVKWELVERNVKAFLDAGGVADWEFLVFKHNEHEVEKAQELAKQWGIRKLNLKTTSRFFRAKTYEIASGFPVYNEQGESVGELQAPIGAPYENDFLKRIERFKKETSSFEELLDRQKISCRVSTEKSLYVSAEGYVFPCCWLGGDFYSEKGSSQFLNWIQKEGRGGLSALSALEQGVQKVLENPIFQSDLEQSWSCDSLKSGKLKTCSRICGTEMRPFEAQFI